MVALSFTFPALANIEDSPSSKLSASTQAELNESESDIPLEMNSSIQYWIGQFTGPLRYKFVQFLDRGTFVRPTIQGILAKKGLPIELYYLAMIESGFLTHATSRTKAVGIWQFMKYTAKLYGLKVNRKTDQRKDLKHSTYAACKYLMKLRREFGSWNLAMAAYNAGEGRIHKAIRIGNSRDYWTLIQKGALPFETSQYVPEFQAAMRIAENPDVYGFSTNFRSSIN